MVIPAVARVGNALGRRYRRAEREVFKRTPSFKNGVSCPSCGWKGSRFAPSSKPRKPNRICPQCHSTERVRALMLWLDGLERDNDRLVMEVAPIGLLQQRCRNQGVKYASLDLRPTKAQICGDLCLMPLRDRSVDLFVCFHVLEHVPDDHTAMAEIGRVLSDGGVAVLSVPWNPSAQETFEDPDADPSEYEAIYGQSDHVRIYGRDFAQRLQTAGLVVEEQIWSEIFTPGEMAIHALGGMDDRFWICRRPQQ